jgi:Ca-activated chloride channel homolog
MRAPPLAISRWPIWVVFLLVLLSFAQSTEVCRSQSHANNQDIIRINVELAVLHATVLDRKRRPVAGLGQANFQIYEDGVLQEIESFSHEDIPVTVGLVIDNSGSMRPKRTEVSAAALAFAHSSNPKDQLFLVNFNEHVSFGLPANRPFTDDIAQLEIALSTLTANGKTALYDAVAAALAHLKQSKLDKQVLIVISDGADNASRYDAAQVLTTAKQSEAIIYTIGIYEQDDPDRNPGALKQLAKATGGEAFLPTSVKDVTAICERIARDIRSQYTITYTPTNIKYDGKYRSIQVKAEAPGRIRLFVRTRAGYYAPLRP